MSLFGATLPKLLAVVTALMTAVGGVPRLQCVCAHARAPSHSAAGDSSASQPSCCTQGHAAGAGSCCHQATKPAGPKSEFPPNGTCCSQSRGEVPGSSERGKERDAEEPPAVPHRRLREGRRRPCGRCRRGRGCSCFRRERGSDYRVGAGLPASARGRVHRHRPTPAPSLRDSAGPRRDLLPLYLLAISPHGPASAGSPYQASR